MSNSLPRTIRRKPSMSTGTSTKSIAKVFGLTVPSLRAWLLPWVRVTVFSLSSAMGRLRFYTFGSDHLAAIALESVRDRERCLQPGRGKIVEDDFANRFEKLEVVPRFADPEHHNGFERRTARQAAGDFRYEDCSIRWKREALPRPLPHPSQRLVVCGALLQRLNLGGRRHHA